MKVASLTVRLVSLFCAIGCVDSVAQAADIGPPEPQQRTADQARCKALGEGFFAVKGSTGCIRISGYVSAGMGFVEPGRLAAPRTGPFAPHPHSFTTTQGAVAVESQFNTEMGPGRVYVQVGGLNLTH
jgi:hypothetical protein